jgi:hypothetical protein
MKKIILILFLIPTLLFSQKKQLNAKQDNIASFNTLIEKLNSTFGGDFSIDAQYFRVNGNLIVKDGVGPIWVFEDWTNDDLKKLTTKELYDRISKKYKREIFDLYSKGTAPKYDSPDGNNIDQDLSSPKYIEMNEKRKQKLLRLKEIQSVDFSILPKSILKISESDYLKIYEQYIYNLDSIEISKFVNKRGYPVLKINSNDYRIYDVKLSDKLTSKYDFSSRPKPDYKEFLIYKKDQVNKRIKKEVEQETLFIKLKRENSFDENSFFSYFFGDGLNRIDPISVSYEKNSEFYSNGKSNDRETIGKYTLELAGEGEFMSLNIEVENLFSNNTQYYINDINIGSDYMKLKPFDIENIFNKSFNIPTIFEYIAVLSQNTLKNYSKKITSRQAAYDSGDYLYYEDIKNNGFTLSKERYLSKSVYSPGLSNGIKSGKLRMGTFIIDYFLAKFCEKIYNSDLIQLHSRVINYLIDDFLIQSSINSEYLNIKTSIIKKTDVFYILIQLGTQQYAIRNSAKTTGVFEKPSFKNSLNQTGTIYKRDIYGNEDWDIRRSHWRSQQGNKFSTLTESNFPGFIFGDRSIANGPFGPCRTLDNLERWCKVFPTEPNYESYGLQYRNYIGWNKGQPTFDFNSKFKEHTFEKYNSEPIIINNSVLNLFAFKNNESNSKKIGNVLKKIPIPIEKLREAKKQLYGTNKRTTRRLMKQNDVEILERLLGTYLFDDYEKVWLKVTTFKNLDDLLKFINKNKDELSRDYRDEDRYYSIDYDTNSLYESYRY